MKKIIFVFTLGMLFSCSDETESKQTSADAAVIRLMRTPNKSTLTQAQKQTIVNYLDKKPEDYKYLIEGENIPAFQKMAPETKSSAKTAEYTINDYMQLQPQYQYEPDFGASAYLESFGDMAGTNRLIYRWTVLKNAIGLFNLLSQENLSVVDGGPLAGYQTRYYIYSVMHQGSYLSGNYGPLGWQETTYTITPGTYAAWFMVGGNLSTPSGGSIPVNATRYANITTVIESNGYYNSF